MSSIHWDQCVRRAILLAAACLAARSAAAAIPLGGFIPFVGIGMTNESKTIDALDVGSIPFIADASNTPGAPLMGVGGPHFELALLDTGAATHIITQEAFVGFDLPGNGLVGENEQDITGSTGQAITTVINDAAGIYAAGLGPSGRNPGTTISMKTGALRGQTSIATLTAPGEWTLPNILGLPMAAQHAIAIRNSQPQIFQWNDGASLRTVRTPQVDFVPLGTGNQQQIMRRAPFKLRPSLGFITGPQYVFNLGIEELLGGIGGGGEVEIEVGNNPASPSVVQDNAGNGGGLFLEVDMTNGARSFQDKEFLFDTGADFTVLSEISAARLGIDVYFDHPDFVLEVEGAGGIEGGIPGYYIDQLNIDTVGGTFTLTNVPIAVLDVPNPNDPGNAIDGVLGMHLFTGRDLVIDANPVGATGGAPSLYIGNPVAQTHTWSAPAASANWATAGSWSASGDPDVMWDADVRNSTAAAKTANVTANSTVYRMTVAGPGAAMTVAIPSGVTLTTYGEALVQSGGRINLQGGKLDAQFVNIEAGGVLAGNGQVFVGTGPVNGAVRNLAGRVAPSGNSGAIGTIAITGDLSNLEDGVLSFDLGGTGAGAFDQLTATRNAFLGGTLEVTLSNFTPVVNNSFTLISAGESIFGQFENLVLPVGFQWNVAYQAKAVVLSVTGIGSTPGDFNNNGSVNSADLTVWTGGFGPTYGGGDFLAWQRGFNGTAGPAVGVPEPGSAALVVTAIVLVTRRKRRA